MVKLEFPGDLVKSESDIFFNALFRIDMYFFPFSFWGRKDCIAWLDDEKEVEEAEPNESRRQQDSKRALEKAEKGTKVLHGERKKSLPEANLWSLVAALLGLMIAILILVIILKSG